jgi:hypothetical protein
MVPTKCQYFRSLTLTLKAHPHVHRAKSGCGSTGRRVTEPQSSSALIGLLCRSSNPPRIPIPPGSKVEAGAPNISKLPAVQPSPVVGSKHSSSNESIANTRASNTSAQATMQECPLCQKLVQSGDLQRHINEELDNIMASAGDSQMMLCSTALGLHASSRPSGRCQATTLRQAAPAGPARQPLPYSNRGSSVAQGSGSPGLACSGASSGRASIVTEQHGSEQADRGKGRKGGQYQSSEACGAEDRGLKRPFGAPAPHDINRQQGRCAALSSMSRAGKQSDQQEASRRNAERPGADSGAGCRGTHKTAGRGRKQPQWPEDRQKAAAPSAKVVPFLNFPPRYKTTVL